ncbi:MAG: dihydroneopterin aldolase [Victivallaceae bacterium]|nr:dihydroneopterin aldolase [Victivallaceae bacterium]
MDTIFIKGISVMALIGTYPDERLAPQSLKIDVELGVDLSAAAASDELSDAVDYSQIEALVVDVAGRSSFRLVEALAGAIGGAIMRDERVSMCEVTVFKPGASAHGEGVAVTLRFPRS